MKVTILNCHFSKKAQETRRLMFMALYSPNYEVFQIPKIKISETGRQMRIM